MYYRTETLTPTTEERLSAKAHPIHSIEEAFDMVGEGVIWGSEDDHVAIYHEKWKDQHFEMFS